MKYFVLCAADGSPLLVEEDIERARDRFERDEKYHVVWSTPDWSEDPDDPEGRKIVMGRAVLEVTGVVLGGEIRIFAYRNSTTGAEARRTRTAIEATAISTGEEDIVRFHFPIDLVAERWTTRILAQRGMHGSPTFVPYAPFSNDTTVYTPGARHQVRMMRDD